ncbi:MAG: universal stress protein [Gammaproteobacteria bacterium]|nr:universal stress protein [Gammaproteobacteria bacterium]
MYKKILVPLDGSALSERVLPIASLLASSLGSSIELVFAIPTPAEGIPEEIKSLARQDGDDYLKKIVNTLSKENGKTAISYSVQTGHPASMIIERAESTDETLILMSSHGYSGIQRLLLGSVAGKVVQATNTPTLLIPANAKNPEGDLVEFKRMIVPLDGSKLAECVLTHAVELCKSLDMELILVRSYNPNFPGSSIRMHDVSKIVHDSAENYIKEKVQELKNKGLKKVSYKVFRGRPTEQITDFAIETSNSLTAMCTHGRNGIGRWMLGSVTNAVIHCSEEPVLVIRGVDEDSC